jgi:hypothetical protein
MTRRSRRRPAAGPVEPKHLRDLENAMRKEWLQRQGGCGPQLDDGADEDQLTRSPQSQGTTRRTT